MLCARIVEVFLNVNYHLFNHPEDILIQLEMTLLNGPETPVNSSSFPAAVLIPLLHEEGNWKLLFTRRTERLSHHRGQVSFPGGSVETGESPRHAALRETCEEIGVQPDAVRILGRLPALETNSRFTITPFIGHLHWPYPLQLNPIEVAKAFRVPLRWLADPVNHKMAPYFHTPGQPAHWLPFFEPYEDEIIWGATGIMVKRLLALLDSH